MQRNVSRIKSCILTIQKRNFQSASPNSVDIKNRPNNSEFAKHFYESHNTNDNLNITILQNNIKTAAAQNIMSTKEVLHLRWNERHLKAYLKQ